MKIWVRLLSGSVAALTLGIILILIVPDAPGFYRGSIKGLGAFAFFPGQPAYLTVQLISGLVESCLVFLSTAIRTSKTLRLLAITACALAIAAFLANIFWLSVVVAIQCALFFAFEFSQRHEGGLRK